MRHAVILAGGSGTRLWPLSRRSRPKQLLRLFEGVSLLHLTRRRIAGLFPPENTWVVTSADYLDLVAAELPELPRENLIGEPVGRDTANAIGLAAHALNLRDGEATMAVFSADHYIEPRDRFECAVRTALDAAERFPDALVTIGVKPASAHTGYGYVRRGRAEPGDSPAPLPVHRVAEFKEKPSPEVAEACLRSGEYLWNCGLFAWRVPTILAELERRLPENARTLRELAARWPELHGTPELARRFGGLHRISIDYAVMEKAANVLVVEMDCRWTDLGSWSAIAAVHAADGAGNTLMTPSALAVEAAGNIVAGEDGHLIVLVGVRDLIVIRSGDATLVCHRDEEPKIRDVVQRVRERFGARYE